MKEKQELKAQISKLDFILLDSKLISTEKTSEAKDFASRFDDIRQKHEDLIKKVGELSDKNREANEENRRLEVQMEDLKKILASLKFFYFILHINTTYLLKYQSYLLIFGGGNPEYP